MPSTRRFYFAESSQSRSVPLAAYSTGTMSPAESFEVAGCPPSESQRIQFSRTLKCRLIAFALLRAGNFIEEGDFQHNCVASYIDRVNSDMCSIWSMRKADNSRNTIEVCCRKSKNNPDGYFYIKQMSAFSNSEPLKEDYERIRAAIERQHPYMET